MLSTADFDKRLFLYKTEGKNMSIQTFCVDSWGNYGAFGKWFRNTRKDIIPVWVVDGPEAETREEKEAAVEQLGSQTTYHAIVQTCRMMGVDVLKYFSPFSESMMKAAATS